LYTLEPPPGEGIAIAKARASRFGDLDAARHAMRLHAAGQIHRVAPEIVNELPGANHPGDHGAGIDPNPELQRFAIVTTEARYLTPHLNRHRHYRLSVVVTRFRQPADDHVGIANRLYLLQPMMLGEPVE